MKTKRNIFIAFILNLSFSVFELLGGIFTGSVAILSDAVHDMGDALSIGISCILERKSKKRPDEKYTYGYARYSVMGGLITTIILILGSVFVLYGAIGRIIRPVEINYKGMILFAVVGVGVNICAAFFTRGGDSVNQKAVNLHMLEDTLGWAVVLAGALIMHFTDLAIIDPIMSVGVSLFILVNALKNLKEIMELFLEKVPHNVDMAEIKEHIEKLDGVLGVHHIHVWSMDGHNNIATMHVVTNRDGKTLKALLREEMREHGIGHVTVEIESESECCNEKECRMEMNAVTTHGHHNHSH